MHKSKRSASSLLEMRTGSEGPRHDPYSYTEYSITRKGITTVLHLGLGCWLQVEIDGKRFGERVQPDYHYWRENHIYLNEMGKADNMAEAEVIARFEKACGGLRLRKFEDLMHRPKSCCSKPRLDWQAGYPGESLCVCRNCGKVVDGSFNEAAII